MTTISDGDCISPTNELVRVEPASGPIPGTTTVGYAECLAAASGDPWLTPTGENDPTRVRSVP